LVSTVAIAEFNEDVEGSFRQALELIGKIDDLNKVNRPVVIKVGVFNHKEKAHSTVPVVSAIINSFKRAPKIFLAESDNYKGTGTERLQIWKELFSKRVVPFNLSEDTKTREVNVVSEKINLSHILFKPNVLVSTHIPRPFEKGSILKNLLGLTSTSKKAVFHKKLDNVLLDLYEAVGGIDLAVLDGTYMYPGVTPKKIRKRIKTNVIVVGRDAVAVEAVGASLVGLEPEKMPLIKEAMKRGLGEGNLNKIKVLGNSVESLKERFRQQVIQEKRASFFPTLVKQRHKKSNG